MAETEGSAVHQYLSFFAAGEEYALPILEVTEILESSQITRMPSMPRSVRGVTHLRGRVVPVVDLAVRLGLPESSLTRRTCIVMVEARLGRERSVVGLLVDSVSQVMDLPPGQIEPPPTFGTRLRVDFVRGMGRVGTHFVPVLELDRLLDVEELLAAGRVARGPAAEADRASTEAARPAAAPTAAAAAARSAS
ncbi:MAG TPA: chemotaxis protein CheW [Myxococcales bacterium]|jgi:purine-binding chemotaxis protein CheW